MKILTFLLGVWLALLVAPAAAGDAMPVPREAATVTGNVVRLGDLFENVGDKAQIAVAYAPNPGKRAYFDSRWLARAAKRHGLAWQPISHDEYVTVERESVVVTRDRIEDNIRQALGEHGLGGDTKIELSNPMIRMHVAGESDAEPEITIEDIAYDGRTGRFNAIIAANLGRATVQRIRVSGRAFKVLRVPVPRRPFAGGEIIAKNDIEFVEIRAERVQPSIIVEAEGLIGKTAKRGLRAGIPVNHLDVARPVLVAKNSLVTMTLRSGRMMLTAQGKALEDGAQGDSIRVANTHSKQTVEAVVIGAGRVAVGRPTPIAMN